MRIKGMTDGHCEADARVSIVRRAKKGTGPLVISDLSGRLVIELYRPDSVSFLSLPSHIDDDAPGL